MLSKVSQLKEEWILYNVFSHQWKEWYLEPS
jgi:hypothetical protein